LDLYPRIYAASAIVYGRAIAKFLDFLSGHIGGEPRLADLEALTPADFRAWHLAATSRAHGLSVLRAFFKFLHTRELVKNAVISAVQTPRAFDAVAIPSLPGLSRKHLMTGHFSPPVFPMTSLSPKTSPTESAPKAR
jgi:hypothetical protein